MKIQLFFLCLLSFMITPLFAKEISLYDQPNLNAKVINKVDPASGIIPIYTSKDIQGWVKIADPRNGNVGWIKSGDMSGEKVEIMQNVLVTPHLQSMPIITTPSTSNPPQATMPVAETQAIQRLEMRQREVEQSTQQLMQATAHYLSAMFEEQARLLSNGKFNPQISQPQLPAAQPTSKTPATMPAAAPTNLAPAGK